MGKNIIIGTAGHIDHGKTTLIKALTGSDTDRLKEEKKRGISIDLGFTSFRINEKKSVGIIDVPGHEKFLKNMLAGVAGMDLVLLVVSAEEGVMPQTREHLDILNLIGIKRGLVVITKADKVEEDFLSIVQEDILEEIKGSFLEEAEVLTVDSISGRGMEELIKKIDRLTEEFEDKNLTAPPRLFVDRAFSVKGFGTVVTGTLIEGRLSLDEEIHIYPEKIPTKVRGIQVHSQSSAQAFAGQRVALNLAGVTLSQVKRGDILCGSPKLPVSMMIDAKITVLPSAVKDLEHWDRVRVYHGAREIIGRIVPLESPVLKRGESGFVQIRLEESIATKETDHIVLRLYSPMQTVGGGLILDANPKKHNIGSAGVIEHLRLRQEGNIGEKIENCILRNPFLITKAKVTEILGIGEEVFLSEWIALIEEGKILELNNLLIHRENLSDLTARIQKTLSAYHKKYPYRRGVGKEELRNKISKTIKPKEFDMILQSAEDRSEVEIRDNFVFAKGFSVIYEGEALKIKNEIEKHYAGNYTPPAPSRLIGSDPLKNEVFHSLLGRSLVFLEEDMVYDAKIVEEFKLKTMEFLERNGRISIQEFKEIFGLSRKYMIAIFEYLDREKITKRSGDYRIKY
ncbi:MAG: selenocysteine-specific translation elongation factor [Peptostreptococcaceae bacterium]|nr:selenocysteine-specific translation elongation factor [Peptostreptococcaceae bacterium]